MQVEVWPINKPVPYARNARVLSPKAVDKVAASIKEFGWKQPIVVDKENVIIVGHTRLLAAKKLGLAEVPVVVANDLTPAQVKAYRLTDNRVAQETSWDYELLNIELEELATFDFDVSITGFDTDEIFTPDSEYAIEAEEGEDEKEFSDFEFRVVVECLSEEHQAEVLSHIQELGWTCKALTS